MRTRRTAKIRRAATLKAAVEALAPVVKDLRKLEHDLSGIDRQLGGIPWDSEGPEELLDRCQRAADVRFRQIVGRRFRFADREWVSASDVRDILKAIGVLAEFTGVGLDVVPVPNEAPIWTRADDVVDGIYYDQIPKGASRNRAESKFRLVTKLQLNPDGSFRRLLLRRRTEDEEE